MSIIQTELNSRIFLELTEGEAAALDALVGYGDKAFIKAFLPVFYEKLGKHYLQPHEKYIPSLFEKARKLSSALEQLKEARKKITVIKTD